MGTEVVEGVGLVRTRSLRWRRGVMVWRLVFGFGVVMLGEGLGLVWTVFG